MFKFLKPQLSAVLLLASMFCSAESLAQAALPQAAGAKPWLNLGRAATDAEVKAWDIDVRADFVGLPKGAGSVSKGEEVWEAKCASCHGTFGESNEVFTPIVGGTTKKDIEAGLVANLTRPDFPQRTTMMKLSTVSTLWDYINRAMPWNAPKSLKVDEVYAVTAYILHLAEVLPADFTLSDQNIADVQKRIPNRNGKVKFTGLWDLKGRPDVQGELCMNNCKVSAEVASILPEFARNAHGNIAEQNRLVGPSRGADTTKPPLQEPLKVAIASGAAQAPKLAVAAPKSALTLAKEQNCLACHGVEQKMVGPAFREIAARYKGNMKAEATLVSRISQGGSGNWGQIPMPAQPQVSSEDLKTLARWILEGAK
jgi:cytochrome c551/c552